MSCQSCGMPMDKPEDHGGGDVNSLYCRYCTDEQGKLMPREQVRAKMIQFYLQKQGKDQTEAEKLTDQLMGTMPAWKREGEAAPAEPVASAEPTVEPAPPAEPVTESSPPESTTEPTPPAEPEAPASEPVEETPTETPSE